MALHLFCGFLVTTLIFMQTLADTASTDCFTHSRAAYYPNSEDHGTDGACGFGSFGATINGGDVSAASDLYRNGVGCGACYQWRSQFLSATGALRCYSGMYKVLLVRLGSVAKQRS
ncbi:hypothetical protein RJT34_33530 [Clitoria ternatea]|uniref:Expansin-like EG45 domain-containing protein n=1 Tax=Clitoria ternatea TaxID=43366 RepID=A0AAN9F2B9_CLITE